MKSKSLPGVIALRVFLVVFPVLVVFSGWKLIEQKAIKEERRDAEERNFQAWVEWRGENCRLQGGLTHGKFVCNNGVVFPARADRWGEWRHYPDFIRKQHQTPQATAAPSSKDELAHP